MLRKQKDKTYAVAVNVKSIVLSLLSSIEVCFHEIQILSRKYFGFQRNIQLNKYECNWNNNQYINFNGQAEVGTLATN